MSMGKATELFEFVRLFDLRILLLNLANFNITCEWDMLSTGIPLQALQEKVNRWLLKLSLS